MPTNFLWQAGTGNSGLLVSSFTIVSTELKSLASGTVVVSSVNGSSGLFTNSNTGQAIWADVFFYAGNPAVTPTAGANVAGWWLTSPDSGVTFENTTLVPARAPDFIIPLGTVTTNTASTIASGRSSGIVRVPALQTKVLIHFNLGVTMSAGGTTSPFITVSAYAVQY